jgi:Domain of unknown function (DUF4190)
MKTNPTCAKAECPKEFPDNLNFCQLCGARLTAVVAEDPFKTVVASSSASRQDDLLYVPESPVEEIDNMKTSVVSNVEIPEIPPSAPSVPLPLPPIFDEPKPATPNFVQPPTPKVESVSLPDLENDATLISSEVPDFDMTFTGMPLPSNSPYRSPTDELQASPFEQPGSNPFETPASSQTPSFMEPEASPQNDPFGSPFNPPPSPFGQRNQMEQAWTPPPAPDANWSNQGVGQNTPFQPPPISGGQNQTLPIVSLVFGILSVCCYISPVTGAVALITGYLGIKNINNDPGQFGGKGLAIAGMIVGGIFFAFGLLYWVYILFVIGMVASGNLK